MLSESALRRRAAQQEGFSLQKSRRAESLDNLGHWMIVDSQSNWVVAGERFDMTDVEVERLLSED